MQFYGCNYYAILVLYVRVYCIIVRKYCKVKATNGSTFKRVWHKWVRLQVNVAQLGPPSSRCGISGCAYKKVWYKWVILRESASPTGSPKSGCGKNWVAALLGAARHYNRNTCVGP
jgi:hypothetical protein